MEKFEREVADLLQASHQAGQQGEDQDDRQLAQLAQVLDVEVRSELGPDLPGSPQVCQHVRRGRNQPRLEVHHGPGDGVNLDGSLIPRGLPGLAPPAGLTIRPNKLSDNA